MIRLIITIFATIAIIFILCLIIGSSITNFKGGKAPGFSISRIDKRYVQYNNGHRVYPVYEVFHNNSSNHILSLQYYPIISADHRTCVFKIGVLTSVNGFTNYPKEPPKDFKCFPPLFWTPKYNEKMDLEKVGNAVSKVEDIWKSELKSHYRPQELERTTDIIRSNNYQYMTTDDKLEFIESENIKTMDYVPMELKYTTSQGNLKPQEYVNYLCYDLTDAEKYFHQCLFMNAFSFVLMIEPIKEVLNIVYQSNDIPICMFCHVGSDQFTGSNVDEFKVGTWDAEMVVFKFKDSDHMYKSLQTMDEMIHEQINEYINTNKCLQQIPRESMFIGSEEADVIVGGSGGWPFEKFKHGCMMIKDLTKLYDNDKGRKPPFFCINGYQFRGFENSAHVIKFGVASERKNSELVEYEYHKSKYNRLNFRRLSLSMILNIRLKGTKYTNNVVLVIQYLLDLIEQTAHKIAYDECVKEAESIRKVTRFSDSTVMSDKDAHFGTGYAENVAYECEEDEEKDNERFKKICAKVVSKVKEFCVLFMYGDVEESQPFDVDNIPCTCVVDTSYFDVVIQLKNVGDDEV